MSTDASGTLFSHYLGSPEVVTQLPILVKANMENGNDPAGSLERTVIAAAMGVPLSKVNGIVDVTKLLANFVPRGRWWSGATDDFPADAHDPVFGSGRESLSAEPSRHGALGQVHGQLRDPRARGLLHLEHRDQPGAVQSGLQAFDFGSQNWATPTSRVTSPIASGEFPIRADIRRRDAARQSAWLVRDGTGVRVEGARRPATAIKRCPTRSSRRPRCRRSRIPGALVGQRQQRPDRQHRDNDALNEALAAPVPILSPGYDEFRAARITELIKSELGLIPTPPGTRSATASSRWPTWSGCRPT